MYNVLRKFGERILYGFGFGLGMGFSWQIVQRPVKNNKKCGRFHRDSNPGCEDQNLRC